MFEKIAFCFFLQVLLYYCKTSVSNPLIGKSREVKIREFPFIVSLSKKDGFINVDNNFCAGTLVSKRHVLTADHCMENQDINNVMVIACTVDFDCGKIYMIRFYESYDSWKYFTQDYRDRDEEEHDIGIITLKQEVKNVQPAIISNKLAEKLYGSSVVTAGWGFIDEEKLMRPKSLLKAEIKILSPSDYKKYTQKKYGYSKTPLPQFFYTMSDPPVVLSASDSGGPLVLKNSNEVVAVNVGYGIESPHSSCILSSPLRYAMSIHTKINYSKHQVFIEEIITRDEIEVILG